MKRHNNRRNIKRLLVLLFLGMAMTATGAVLASGGVWPGAGPVVGLGNFPESPGNAPRPMHSLAVSEQDDPALLWPALPTVDEQELKLAEMSGGTWSTSTLTSSTQDLWAPELVYSGTQLIALWLEGDHELWLGELVQMDVTTGATVSIKSDVRGFTNPELAIAPTGMHLVFTSASPALTKDKGSLYYAQRDLDDQDFLWSFGQIVANDQVITGAEGIWYPRIALSNDGTQAHLVWHQTLSAAEEEGDQVWYMAGTWDGGAGNMTWSEPQRITAPWHTRMVEPDVAVDSYDDSVYITWVQWIWEPKVEQYVYLCRWNGSTCEVLEKLNDRSLEVSEGAPLWGHPSVVVDRPGYV